MAKNYRNYASQETFYEEHGDTIFEHQSAMTGEALHSKIEIAYELAWRDVQIENLLIKNKQLRDKFKVIDQAIDSRIEDLNRLDEGYASAQLTHLKNEIGE